MKISTLKLMHINETDKDKKTRIKKLIKDRREKLYGKNRGFLPKDKPFD